MQIRLKSNGQVMYESEFRALHPNTSLPQQLTEALINEFGGDVVFEGPQATPTRYQTAYRNGVELVDGKWYTKYSVADMEDKAKTAKDAEQAKSVRNNRDQLLKDSDWTQVADAPVDKQAWAIYRQSLRDITAQSGFPWEVTWSNKP